MKRFTLFFAILSVLVACSAHAAQQPITTITSGTGTSGKTLKQYNDNDITPRLTYINENFTDLYTNAAFKSCFLTTAAWASCFPDLPLVGSDLSLSAIKTYIIDDATVVTGAEIGSVFTGTGEYLKKDGTTGDPPGGTGSGPTFLASDPTSPTDNSMWYNTTSNELKIATADGLWADGTFAAWSPVDAFQFTDLTNQTADGLLKCSAAITPTGANHSWPVTVSGDAGCSVKINGGTAADTGTWAPTQTVEACVNASSSASTTTSCTPSIGAVAATQAFTITTATPVGLCSGSYLVCEQFEDGGTPVGWSFVGTPNFDYPLSDREVLQIKGGEWGNLPELSPQSTLEVDFLFQASASTIDSWFAQGFQSNQSVWVASLGSDNKVTIYSGAYAATSTLTIDDNVLYHVWIVFAQGSGSNGVLSLYITPAIGGETRPLTATASILNSDSTMFVDNISLRQSNNTGGYFYFDDVRVSQ